MTPKEAAQSLLDKWESIKTTWPVKTEGHLVIRGINSRWELIACCMEEGDSSDFWEAYPEELNGEHEWTKFSTIAKLGLEKLASDSSDITLTKLAPGDYKKIPKRIEIRNGETIFPEIKW